MEPMLIIGVIGGWWLAVWWTEGEVWAFGWLSALILVPILIASLLVFSRDSVPTVFSMYLAACALTAVWLLRGNDTTWTPRSVAIAALANLTMVAVAAAYIA